MSQRCVEQVIGRLVTDEAFRRRFADAPEAALLEFTRCGLELTGLERRALASIDLEQAAAFGERIDPRLQKAALLGEEP